MLLCTQLFFIFYGITLFENWELFGNSVWHFLQINFQYEIWILNIGIFSFFYCLIKFMRCNFTMFNISYGITMVLLCLLFGNISSIYSNSYINSFEHLLPSSTFLKNHFPIKMTSLIYFLVYRLTNSWLYISQSS